MKNTLLFISLLLITISSSGHDKKEASNEISKKKVLVVSFIEKNFKSTYEIYEISKENGIDSETILSYLDDKICGSFPKSVEVEFIKCTDKPKIFETNVTFSSGKKDILIPNLSEIDNVSFNKLFEAYHVDYIMFINGYEINWIDDPQFKVENNIHFTILVKDRKQIVTTKQTFSTPKLISFDKMEKRIQKLTMKIYTKYFKKLI